MSNWQELDSKYCMQTIARVPVTLVRGDGARVWDDEGKEYLDFVNGLAVNCLGSVHACGTRGYQVAISAWRT